jgi:hypothetical protein
MKKVALTVAVLALGLAACESKTENAVENTTVDNAIETDANMAMESTDNAVDNALDDAGNAVENGANAVDNAAANTVNAADHAM